VLWTQASPTSEMMWSYTCVFRMWSKMSTFTHNRTNRVIIKNATIMNIIHNTNVYVIFAT